MQTTHSVFLPDEIPSPDTFCATLIAACDPAGRILLQLRDDKPTIAWPAHWALFGGRAERGETLLQSALREFYEETAIRLDPQQLAPLYQTRSPSIRKANIYIFECLIPVNPQDIQLHEGAGFAFVTREQLAQLPLVPYLSALFTTWPAIRA